MHSVLETSIFTRRADALLTHEERAELISVLARNPHSGDLVPGLGGIRKMRFAASGQGSEVPVGSFGSSRPRTCLSWHC
jgi:hypothetical protein